MLLDLFLSLAAQWTNPVFELSGWTAQPRQEKTDAAAEIRAAGKDVAKLVKLAETWLSKGDEESARAAWTAVLSIDAQHEAAHKGLRHHFYDGKWFDTYAALSAYQREEAEKMRTEKGLVRFGEQWVPEKDLVFLRMGWKRDAEGAWLRPGDEERLALEAKYKAEGRQQQDSTWIHPDEFGPWREGKWKCGEEWLATDAANAWHAGLDRAWLVPTEHFLLRSTCARDVVQYVIWHADRTVPDLVRIFGTKPERKPELVILKSLAEYNLVAGGDGGALQPTEQTGHSGVHFAYFAESWFDFASTPGRWRGAGVGYWEAGDPKLAPFGLHAVRHAAAQSWVDAIDPSWAIVSEVLSTPGTQMRSAEFWAAKKIPQWLRFGAASYVERFFRDDQVGDGGDPLWARKWAIENLSRQGGFEPLAQVFDLTIDAADPALASRRIAEAGLVVAFVLDGGCAAVVDKHDEFKDALAQGGDVAAAAKALADAVTANEAKLKAFAGF